MNWHPGTYLWTHRVDSPAGGRALAGQHGSIVREGRVVVGTLDPGLVGRRQTARSGGQAIAEAGHGHGGH